MGSMAGMFASKGAQAAGKGASTGYQTGSSIANAQYNASSLRQQADSLDQQNMVTSYLIRKQYESDYKTLLEKQTAQMSMNRVVAAKNGITGASADNVMQSYAAQGQKNLEQLYYNAAMQTGSMSLQYSSKATALRERASQYDWKATSALIGGVLNFATGYFDQAITSDDNTQSPTSAVSQSEKDIMRDVFSTKDSSNSSIMGSAGDFSMSSLPSLS